MLWILSNVSIGIVSFQSSDMNQTSTVISFFTSMTKLLTFDTIQYKKPFGAKTF